MNNQSRTSWPGVDEPPESPLWPMWVAIVIGAWAIVGGIALAAVTILPWLVDKVLQ